MPPYFKLNLRLLSIIMELSLQLISLFNCSIRVVARLNYKLPTGLTVLLRAIT